jgi:hypothetical protein
VVAVSFCGLEDLGDRQGHSLQVGDYSCRVIDGPMAGAILTGTGVWEWDGATGTFLSGFVVVRKPGATVVSQTLSGKAEATMSDGKATGWTASGQTVWLLATGSAESIKGKTISWTAKGTGPHEFEVTSTVK